jgi:hypothetical protein
LQPKKTEDSIARVSDSKVARQGEFIAKLIKDNQAAATNGIVIVMAGTAGMEYYQMKLRDGVAAGYIGQQATKKGALVHTCDSPYP